MLGKFTYQLGCIHKNIHPCVHTCKMCVLSYVMLHISLKKAELVNEAWDIFKFKRNMSSVSPLS